MQLVWGRAMYQNRSAFAPISMINVFFLIVTHSHLFFISEVFGLTTLKANLHITKKGREERIAERVGGGVGADTSQRRCL